MKSLASVVSALILTSLSSIAFATSDGHTRVYLVVKHVQTDEFFVERAPMIGCYGMSKDPQVAQFTAPYMAPSNIGCGAVVASDDINALSCAKVISHEYNPEYTTLQRLELDISGCADKEDAGFIKAINSAARMNFKMKASEFKLVLKK